MVWLTNGFRHTDRLLHLWLWMNHYYFVLTDISVGMESMADSVSFHRNWKIPSINLPLRQMYIGPAETLQGEAFDSSLAHDPIVFPNFQAAASLWDVSKCVLLAKQGKLVDLAACQ